MKQVIMLNSYRTHTIQTVRTETKVLFKEVPFDGTLKNGTLVAAKLPRGTNHISLQKQSHKG